MKHLQRMLSKQANFTCPACGQHSEALQLHTVHVARNILDRYNPRYFVVVCPTCHKKVHKKHKPLE